MPEPAVRLSGVTKDFKGSLAVKELDLEIARGEFFSLLGPSGCGKTTTLRLIAGLEQPTSGQIEIAGVEVAGVPAYKRNVNTVFQSYALFPHLDVFENVAFGLRRKNLEDRDIQDRVQQTLDMMGLEDFARRDVRGMSGGQRQRVALARALVNEPEVLLLDEPMAALDSQLKRKMRRDLKDLQRQLGITFVLVTHDQEEALTLSDRVAVLYQGRLMQVSTPRELYTRPVNRFVAEFMGTTNILPVEVQSTREGVALVEFNGVEMLVSRCNGFVKGDTCQWAVRPEHLELIRERNQDGRTLPATVKEALFMGPATRYTVEVADGHNLLVEHLNRHPGALEVGEEVFLHWGEEVGTLLHVEDDTA